MQLALLQIVSVLDIVFIGTHVYFYTQVLVPELWTLPDGQVITHWADGDSVLVHAHSAAPTTQVMLHLLSTVIPTSHVQEAPIAQLMLAKAAPVTLLPKHGSFGAQFMVHWASPVKAVQVQESAFSTQLTTHWASPVLLSQLQSAPAVHSVTHCASPVPASQAHLADWMGHSLVQQPNMLLLQQGST